MPKKLLTGDEEKVLARKVQTLQGWQAIQEDIEDETGKAPSTEEWAAAAGFTDVEYVLRSCGLQYLLHWQSFCLCFPPLIFVRRRMPHIFGCSML